MRLSREKIDSRMLALKMTRRDLAEELKITRQGVAQILWHSERGRNFQIETTLRLLRALQCKAEDIQETKPIRSAGKRRLVRKNSPGGKKPKRPARKRAAAKTSKQGTGQTK